MNRELSPALATEMLKEMLRIKTEVSPTTHSSSAITSSTAIREAGAAATVSSTVASFSASADFSSNQSFINGKSLSNNRMKSGGEMEEISRQKIVLQASDENVSYRVEGNHVDVICHRPNHTSGSSKVKIRNIVNSVWENRYYHGQLVATHLSKNYIAYCIKIPNSEDGAVRVMNRKSNGRLLLKGMKGLVVDIAFAHLQTEVILGAIDEYANIFVYSISAERANLEEKLLLEVRRPEESISKSKFRRLIWCPFVEELSTDEEVDPSECSKTMVVSYGNEVEIWNVDVVQREFGNGPHYTKNITEGYHYIKEHLLPVADAAFPPDGTALATCSDDGSVKFYQVDERSETQTCLHNWVPHEGRPLSCLFFLDNKRYAQSEVQYWKYAITGCDQNRELKVWNCATWQCLQTIRFHPAEDSNLIPELQARMDESAEFLILSNISHRVLYVLDIFQDREVNLAKVVCLSEFPVISPIVSMDVVDVRKKKLKRSSDDDDQMDDFNFGGDSGMEEFQAEEEEEVGDKVDEEADGLVLKLVYVQPKSLQECVIAFQSTASFPRINSFSSVSHDSSFFKDKLSDLSFEGSLMDVSGGSVGASFNATRFSMEKSNMLLTPDVFTLPSSAAALTTSTADQSKLGSSSLENSFVSGSDRTLVALDRDPPSSASSPNKRTDSKSNTPSKTPLLSEQMVSSGGIKRDSLKSTGSSPSLEVQEILNKSLAEELEEESKIEDVLVDEIEDSMNQEEEDANLINLGSDKFGLLSNIPCIPDDFMKKRQSHAGMSWPTVPQLPANNSHDKRLAQEMGVKNSSNDSALIEKMSANIETLLRVAESQQIQMTAMKKGMAELQLAQSQNQQKAPVTGGSNDLTVSLKSLLEKHHQAGTNIISGLLKSYDDKIMTSLTQMTGRLDSVIKFEIQNAVHPLILREVKQFLSMIHNEVMKSLAGNDAVLSGSLVKLTESKAFLSNVSGAMSVAFQGSIKGIFQEVMMNNVVPSYERVCNNMFLQINDSFKNGTKEYAHNLELKLEKDFRHNQEFVNGQLQGVIAKVQSSAEQMSVSASGEISNQLQAVLKRFEEQLSSRISCLLQEQMSVAMKEHREVIGNTVVNAIRSRTVTPVPTDFQITQAQIVQLISQGQINGAFKQALSVNDLGLVMFLCEKVSAAQIFNQNPCPLQPPVLLALISQLSADLETHIELKHEYLREAVMNMDMNEPIIVSHSPKVLETLRQKLQLYIQAHPTGKMTKDLRLLLMATSSVLKPM